MSGEPADHLLQSGGRPGPNAKTDDEGMERMRTQGHGPPPGFVRAARSEDIPALRFVRVELTDKAVLLSRLTDGTPVAFSPVCPHRNNPLDGGSLWEDAIDCPHHHYMYDPRTGKNIYPANVFPEDRARAIGRLPVYDVREEEGWIWVGPEKTPDESEAAGD